MFQDALTWIVLSKEIRWFGRQFCKASYNCTCNRCFFLFNLLIVLASDVFGLLRQLTNRVQKRSQCTKKQSSSSCPSTWFCSSDCLIKLILNFSHFWKRQETAFKLIEKGLKLHCLAKHWFLKYMGLNFAKDYTDFVSRGLNLFWFYTNLPKSKQMSVWQVFPKSWLLAGDFKPAHAGSLSPTSVVLTDRKRTVHFWAALHFYSIANFVSSWLKWLEIISNDYKWLHLTF